MLGPCASAPDYPEQMKRFKETKGASWGGDVPPPKSPIVVPAELQKREAAIKTREQELNERSKALDERELELIAREEAVVKAEAKRK